MIEVKKISFKYGDKLVLDDLELILQSGKIYCLVGENGAGKTTLIESILDMKKTDAIIKFNGQNFQEVKRNVGVVFQENALQPRIKVSEELDAFSEIYKTPKEWKEELISRFKLDNLLDKYGLKLSGGERRRVLIALAFINKPKYIILDEPFTGIDTKLRNDFRNFIEDYVKLENATFIFSEHNLFECKKHNYIFLFLRSGKIALKGTAEEIVKKLKVEEKMDIQDIYINLWKGVYDEKITNQ